MATETMAVTWHKEVSDTLTKCGRDFNSFDLAQDNSVKPGYFFSESHPPRVFHWAFRTTDTICADCQTPTATMLTVSLLADGAEAPRPCFYCGERILKAAPFGIVTEPSADHGNRICVNCISIREVYLCQRGALADFPAEARRREATDAIRELRNDLVKHCQQAANAAYEAGMLGAMGNATCADYSTVGKWTNRLLSIADKLSPEDTEA